MRLFLSQLSCHSTSGSTRYRVVSFQLGTTNRIASYYREHDRTESSYGASGGQSEFRSNYKSRYDQGDDGGAYGDDDDSSGMNSRKPYNNTNRSHFSRSGMMDENTNVYNQRGSTGYGSRAGGGYGNNSSNSRGSSNELRNKAQRQVRAFMKENHVSRQLLRTLGVPYKCIVEASGEKATSLEQENANEANTSKEGDQSLALESFDLPQEMISVLKDKMKLKEFFAIQALTFAELRAGKDVIARSRTGTGKTLAFAIPALEMILKKRSLADNNSTGEQETGTVGMARPKVLVITPTRELCLQVKEEFCKLGNPLGIRTVAVYGGADFDSQKRELLGESSFAYRNKNSYYRPGGNKYHSSDNRSNSFRHSGGDNQRYNRVSNNFYSSGTVLKGADVVVGTPGRLHDFLERSVLDLGLVQFIVLDEADRMLDMGFSEDMESLFATMNKHQQALKKTTFYQTCLFSATMPENMLQMALSRFLKSNKRIFLDTIGDSPVRVATTIKQYCIQDPSAGHSAGRSSVRDTMILDLLKDLAVKNAVQSNNQIESSIDSTTVIASNPVSKLPKVIIFVERKRDADHYVRLLSLNGLSTVDSEGHRRKYTAAALHGDISQVTRERTLNQFRKGYLDCLVCTDVAARGLDIPSVDIVLQLEPPTSPETYIHRVGRTGRAGNSGVSIIFYSPSEHGFAMAAIQEIIGKKFIIYKPSVKSPQVRFNDSSASDHI